MGQDQATLAAYSKALDDLLAAVENDVAGIARELDNRVHFDTAKVTMALGRIMQISHRSIQLLSKIATARAAQEATNTKPSLQGSRDRQTLNNNVYTVRTAMRNWHSVESLVRGQIPPKKRPLYPSLAEATRAQQIAGDMLVDRLHAVLNPAVQDEGAREHGCYADITLPISEFMAHVHAACRVTLAQRLRHRPRFLDVGCGGGTKVLGARSFFEHADGLEYDRGYVTAAERLFDDIKIGGCKVFHADGLTYEGYDQYDVIYFYRPMRDQETLQKLEHQITRMARPGTLIIAPYVMFDARHKQLGCAHLADRLYVKGLTQAAANALRRKAELVGPFPSIKQQSAPSLWDPILKASRQNGYGTSL